MRGDDEFAESVDLCWLNSLSFEGRGFGKKGEERWKLLILLKFSLLTRFPLLYSRMKWVHLIKFCIVWRFSFEVGFLVVSFCRLLLLFFFFSQMIRVYEYFRYSVVRVYNSTYHTYLYVAKVKRYGHPPTHNKFINVVWKFAIDFREKWAINFQSLRLCEFYG